MFKEKNKYLTTELMLLFVIIFALVMFDFTEVFDAMVYLSVSSIRNTFLDKVFVLITNLGSAISVGILVVLLMLLFKNKYSLLLGGLTANAVLTNTIIKYIVRRDRPDVERLVTENGYSFPSGHTMIAIAVYGCLIYIIAKEVKNVYVKWLLIALLVLVIVAVAVSRVYVGVHFATDVLAGAALGLVELLFIIRYFEKKTLGE